MTIDYKGMRKRTAPLPANFGKPWSPDEDTTIREAFANGASVADIARKQMRTQSSVRLRLEKLGLIEP